MKQIILNVNGKKHDLLINYNEVLSSVLRDRIGLTGTKIGCEQGSCGACTVLVDDKPILSCITPAIKCNGKNITTIEGMAQNGKLHMLQEKFVKKGALQCGYCTPGMIMSAIGYLNEDPNPGIKEIKEAIKPPPPGIKPNKNPKTDPLAIGPEESFQSCLDGKRSRNFV